jgi:hypothetical protein
VEILQQGDEVMMSLTIILVAWLAVSLPLALVVGRAMRAHPAPKAPALPAQNEAA